MNKTIIGLSLALLGAGSFVTTASAQRYDARIDVPAVVNADRDYDRDRGFRGGGDWERRVREDLARLNGEIAQMRREIGDSRNGRIRDRFHAIRERADRLNATFAQHRMRGDEVRRRIGDIRGQLDALRREMREHRHWRDR